MVGTATTEEEGVALALKVRPDLLVCSADLETGYGLNLLKRVKSAVPSCQTLIMLVQEMQENVQEVLEACADGLIFKSTLGTGRCGLISALQTIGHGGLSYPELIRRLAVPESPRADLPALIEA